MENAVFIGGNPKVFREYVDILHTKDVACNIYVNSADACVSTVSSKPDIVFLDVEVDDYMNGYDICQRLRSNPLLRNTPIAFLSDKDENYCKIMAYKAGADDYISIPLNSHLFLHKVTALTKRVPKETRDKKQLETHLVSWRDEMIELSPKEFAIWNLMLSDSKKVFTRNEIISKVWQGRTHILPRTIDVHVRKLRAKLGRSVIESVKGIGYRANVN